MSGLNTGQGREPLFNVPTSVLVGIALLVIVHTIMTFGVEEPVAFLLDFGFVPARLLLLFHDDPLATLLNEARSMPDQVAAARLAALAQYTLSDDASKPWTLVTYALLHGSWTHLVVNGIWLLAFGAPVARRLGATRFFALLAFTAICGALMHFAAHPDGVEPLIGASAAVSGAMAAATRFVFQPGAPLGPFPLQGENGYLLRALSLRETFSDRRALIFLAVWFGVNFISGVMSPNFMGGDSIAWEAHLGGFLGGLLAFQFFDPVRSS
jgi:membrane associated rhomboid family serine protease